MSTAQTLRLPTHRLSLLAGLKIYGEFMRIGFVNILAFRLRYYTGIITYLIKPVSVQWMWLARAMGESAFRLILLTAPTAIIIALLFPVNPPASKLNFALFFLAAIGSFFIMGALNFLIGTCAIPLTSILALIRAKFWLIELLSGLLIPLSFFPRPLQIISSWLPFEHIAATPLQIYLGRLSLAASLRLLALEYFWVIVLLVLGHLWWLRATRKITIHGG